jgi:hypothetical protein
MKASNSKITKFINKQIAIDEKYPIDSVKLELKSVKSEKESKEDQTDVSKKDLSTGFQEANQDGYQDDKKFVYDAHIPFNGKIKISSKDTHKSVRVDYDTINAEKRRYTSGHREKVSLEEFYKMNGPERLRLQGAAEPYILFPKMNDFGNIPFADTNARSGSKRPKYSSELYANEYRQ